MSIIPHNKREVNNMKLREKTIMWLKAIKKISRRKVRSLLVRSIRKLINKSAYLDPDDPKAYAEMVYKRYRLRTIDKPYSRLKTLIWLRYQIHGEAIARISTTVKTIIFLLFIR